MPRTLLTARQLRFPIDNRNRDALKAALDELMGAMDATYGVAADYAIAHVNAPGAIDPTKRITHLTIDGTDAFTLANPPAGTLAGYSILIWVRAGTTTPIGTVTPATPAFHTNVTALGVVGDFVVYIWTGTAWVPGANQGVTITP